MLKKLVYSLITKTGVAAINFAILLFSSRYLGVSTRGEISIFVLNITIIQLINEVYTGYSIIHFIPKFNFKKIFIVGLMYSVIFCSLSNSILILLHKQLENYEWMAYVISLLVILNTFNCVLILGKQNLRMFNILSLLQPLLLFFGIIIFIFLFKIYTVQAFIMPLFFSFIASFTGSSFVVSKYYFSKINSTEFQLKPILLNGLMYQSGSVMFIFCNRYSYYLLADTASVGLYSSASSLMEAVLIIVNGISPVLLSRIANKSSDSDNWQTSLTLSKGSLLFSLFVCLCIMCIPSSVFVMILGSGFTGIKSVMLWYAPAVLMASFFMVISNYFVASGNQKSPTIAYGVGCLTSLFLAPYLIEKYAIKGAALNANISFLIIGIIFIYFFLKLHNQSLIKLFRVSIDLQQLKKLIFPKT